MNTVYYEQVTIPMGTVHFVIILHLGTFQTFIESIINAL